jgi:hypothetical protein
MAVVAGIFLAMAVLQNINTPYLSQEWNSVMAILQSISSVAKV